MPGLAWTTIFLSLLSHIAGMTGMHHYSQTLVEMGLFVCLFVFTTFCHYRLQTMILLISIFQVVRITGLSLWTQLACSSVHDPNTGL
jgi:hypothetical protein